LAAARRIANFGITLVAVAALGSGGCGRKRETPRADGPPEPSGHPAEADAPPSRRSPATSSQPTAPPARTAAAPTRATSRRADLWKEFSGEKAMAEVIRQVNLGPRPSGSAELEKARELITASLRHSGWAVERQEFSDHTPRGPIRFVNLIARYPAPGASPAPGNTQQAIVCSHYDTKRFSTIRFVGANDAGSSTGALLELARVLALDPAFAEKIELVFFDGEEALVQFTETDGLHGSRFYAKTLRESGRAAQFRFGILWDMIGDRDLTVTFPPDSPRELAQGLFSAAEALGLRSHFGYLSHNILDDHVPLNTVARIPTIDVIDFDYLAWHSRDDTLERLSPESLQKVGAVTIYYLSQTLR
jgi:glutaminyl-peptide cyclotransferase